MPNWMAPFKADEVVFLYVVSPEESTLRWPIFLMGMPEEQGTSGAMGLLIPDAEDEAPEETPGSTDETPTADGPEEADAILAAPSPSAASLPFNPALPLLRVESSPRLLTEPAFRGPPPRPPGASLRHVGPAPGPPQGRTIRLAWGRTPSLTLPSTLTAFRGSYFPLSQGSGLKLACGTLCADQTTDRKSVV